MISNALEIWPDIQRCLIDFRPVSLKETEKNALMNRTDEKFVISINRLPEVLNQLKEEYQILTIEEKNIFQYSSLYFDDSTFQFFRDHHNGKMTRNKIRMRKYCDSQTTYLEIKKKSKERTIKKRIQIADFSLELSSENLAYIQKHIPEISNLNPVLYNDYKRITLVHKTKQERLTFDFDMITYSPNRTVIKDKLNQLVIVEIKQARLDRNSISFQLMKRLQIRSLRISKFCFGILELYDTLALKSNRFKPRLMQLNKVIP